MVDIVSYLNTGLDTSPKSKEASSEMDKDAFMQLLVAQMGNQNAMEPMENTEFISQLAQFSALEQQQNIAAGIELLALTQTASTNSQMVNLIDKRVTVPGSEVSLDGENSAALKFDITEEVTPTEIVVKDQSGVVVRRIPIEQFKAGENEVAFDGKDENGDMLTAGNYVYSILGNDGGTLEGVTSYSNLLVDAVAYQGTDILLRSGETEIDLGDISEVIKN